MSPYIGITGFRSFAEVEPLKRFFEAHRKPTSERQLHVGVMMSRKTLRGEPTKWEEVFPAKEAVADIFRSEATYNALHYADYSRKWNFEEDLAEAMKWGGKGLHAVQLDMIWPVPREIAQAMLGRVRRPEVILQIGSHALEEVGNDPRRLVRKLEKYNGYIQRILFDRSRGKGIKMDAQTLLPLVEAVRQAFPKLGITAAGGLGPDTMHLVKPLQFIPGLSTDVQAGVCPGRNPFLPMSLDRAKRYLIRTLELLP